MSQMVLCSCEKRYILRASDLAIRKNYSAKKCFEGTVLKILKHYHASDIFSFIDSFACNSSCVFVKLNDVILKERSKKFNIPQRSLQKVIILDIVLMSTISPK